MVSGIVAQTEAAGNQIIEKHCGNIRVRSLPVICRNQEIRESYTYIFRRYCIFDAPQ